MRLGVHRKTYKAWVGMRQRCNNPNELKYMNYGGRGIGYDPRWEVYENFLADVGEAPEGTSLDRKDNDGNYTQENCRWATAVEQANNRRMRNDNTSGVVGVSYQVRHNKWCARATDLYSKRIILYLGVSYDEACAARWRWDEQQMEAA